MARLEDKPALHAKFVELKGQGIKQQAIAEQLGVSAQTISEWAKVLPALQAARAVKAMQARLLKIIPTASAGEISQLQDAISKAQKIATS